MQKKLKAAIVSGTAIAVVGGGVAFAYWSTTGSGNGSATTSGGVSDLTVSQTSTISNMYPGDSAQTISGTVKNNADQSAFVNTVTVSIASVTKAAGAPAGTCDETDYSLTDRVMNVQQDLAKNGVASFSGAHIQFNDKADANQDGCKGATVNLSYASN